jgi:hypothetical protein
MTYEYVQYTSASFPSINNEKKIIIKAHTKNTS